MYLNSKRGCFKSLQRNNVKPIMSLNLLDRQCHNVAKHRHCSTWLLFFIYLYLVLNKSVIYSRKCGEKTSEISDMTNVLPSSSQASPQLIIWISPYLYHPLLSSLCMFSFTASFTWIFSVMFSLVCFHIQHAWSNWGHSTRLKRWGHCWRIWDCGNVLAI